MRMAAPLPSNTQLMSKSMRRTTSAISDNFSQDERRTSPQFLPWVYQIENRYTTIFTIGGGPVKFVLPTTAISDRSRWAVHPHPALRFFEPLRYLIGRRDARLGTQQLRSRKPTR